MKENAFFCSFSKFLPSKTNTYTVNTSALWMCLQLLLLKIGILLLIRPVNRWQPFNFLQGAIQFE